MVEHFCEIILKSGHRPRRRCRYRIHFSIYSANGHLIQQSEMNLTILVKGLLKEYFCESTLKSDHWSKRRCLFFYFILGGHFVWRSKTILAILVAHPRNISEKLFEIDPLAY